MSKGIHSNSWHSVIYSILRKDTSRRYGYITVFCNLSVTDIIVNKWPSTRPDNKHLVPWSVCSNRIILKMWTVDNVNRVRPGEVVNVLTTSHCYEDETDNYLLHGSP